VVSTSSTTERRVSTGSITEDWGSRQARPPRTGGLDRLDRRGLGAPTPEVRAGNHPAQAGRDQVGGGAGVVGPAGFEQVTRQQEQPVRTLFDRLVLQSGDPPGGLRQCCFEAPERVEQAALGVRGQPLAQRLGQAGHRVGADVDPTGHPFAAAYPSHPEVELDQEQPELVGRVGWRPWVAPDEVAPVEQHLPLGVADRPGTAGAELVDHPVGVQGEAAVVALPGGEQQLLRIWQERPVPVQPLGRRRGQEEVEVQVGPLVPALRPAGGRAEDHQAGRTLEASAGLQQGVPVLGEIQSRQCAPGLCPRSPLWGGPS